MENLSTMGTANDEAVERLVNEEQNGHKSNDKKVEVKYMTPDSQNGDAKIDIENLKSAFAGMGKEELMKYANDPFWVKMRWFLFILFWVVWIAMLAGAIAIIVLAPKCAAPTPREWWEQSPLYKIDVRNFLNGHKDPKGESGFKVLQSKLDYLNDLGVKTFVLSSVLKSATPLDGKSEAADDNVIDYQEVDERVGTLEQFKELAAAMKEKGLHMLMSFVPNHSSDRHPWFLKSIEAEDPWTDYYVWAKPKGYDSTDGSIPLPPNNWLSIENGSAWQYNEKRKMFYLHQFGKHEPDFNFRNPKVVDYFKNVMKFWLDNGVSGFHLDKVQYLLEDEELRDELPGEVIGATHDQYDFLNHKYTSDLESLSTILQQWNKIPANNSGILSVTGMRPGVDKITSPIQSSNTTSFDDHIADNSIGQLFVRPQILQTVLTGTELEAVVSSTMKALTWPTWDFVCKSGVNCITDEMQAGVLMVSMLLPGTPVTRSGSELGPSGIGGPPGPDKDDDVNLPTLKPKGVNTGESAVDARLSDSNSYLNLYKKLVQMRQSPAITHGSTAIYLIDDSVFVMIRIKSGNPGYMVAFNIQANATTADLAHLKNVPGDLSVIARSPDLSSNSTSSVARSNKLNASAVSLGGYDALVLQFVPDVSGG